MSRRATLTCRALVFAVAVAALAGQVRADPGHEGDEPSTLERAGPRTSATVQAGFAVAGRVRLPGSSADLAFFDHGGRIGPYVYVGSTVSSDSSGRTRCAGGVRIVSVRRPGHARLVATARGLRNVVYEDVEVRRIGRRVVLAVGIQRCEEGAAEGLVLYDVTVPSRPRRLALWRSPSRGVHELDLVVRPDGRALALVATPHSERESLRQGRDLGGDFRVIDVTDPRRPVQLAEWGIVADSSLHQAGGGGEIASHGAGIGGYAVYYGHSVRAADRGTTAYVSYWDAGVLKFDLRDPSSPRLLGRTEVDDGGEGDAHSVTVLEAGGKRYLLQNQEEVDPLSPPVVTSTATGDARLPAIELSWAPRLLTEAGPTTAPVVDAGAGCASSDFAGAAGKLALVDARDPVYVGRIEGWRVQCDVGEQALLAGRAGALGLLVNFVGPDRPTIFRFVPNEANRARLANEARRLFAIAISSIDGGAASIRHALAAGDEVRASLAPQRPTFGGIGVYAEDAARPSADGSPEFPLAASFADVPGTAGRADRGPGSVEWINAHNTELRADRAFASWYSGGIVSLDVRNPTRIRRIGQFAPRGAIFWGVDVDPKGTLVFGSDMASGLWILRPTRGSARSLASSAAGCDLLEHRVDVYNTTVAADVVKQLNERRAALGRAPVAIDGDLWLKAMWRAGRTAASGAPLIFGPDPCPGDAEPLEEGGRSFSRAESPDAILAHPYIAETGKLDVLLAPSTRSMGIGIAFAFSHTSFVVYATDRPASPLRNEPPAVSNDALPVAPAASRHDLAPALLANDRDDQKLVYIVAAEAAHGTVRLGWAIRGYGIFYVPDSGFAGEETLTYTVADAFGATSTGTATFTVARKSEPAVLRLRIGVAGNRVLLNRLARMNVSMTASEPGPVLLIVRRGTRTIGTMRTRVRPGGSTVPVERLLPHSVQPGRFRLLGVYGGRTTRIAFRVV